VNRRIAVTCGEPAGIGPDLCIQLIQQQHGELLFIGDPDVLAHRALQLDMPLSLHLLDAADERMVHQSGVMNLLPVTFPGEVVCGKLDAVNSAVVLETLDIAVKGCLSGDFSAMVTNPVHKGVINDGGFSFSGHTEYIAAQTGGYPVMMLACEGLRVALMTTHLPLYIAAQTGGYPVMMLACEGLRVALMTTHLPLSEVPAAISGDLINKVMRILHQELQSRFGIDSPEILVCGLNPHAGEGGHLGSEELEIIAPVLEALREEGISSHGPLPADTLFTPRYLKHADAVVAMYHDQGLPVLKHMGFGRAVNITLGLPLVRTSVDHGTALDLAGTGRAEIGSLAACANLGRPWHGAGSRWYRQGGDRQSRCCHRYCAGYDRIASYTKGRACLFSARRCEYIPLRSDKASLLNTALKGKSQPCCPVRSY